MLVHFQGQKKFYTATSKYEYKSSSGGGSGKPGGGHVADSSVTDVYKQNINQLDNLLSDLERERDSSLDRSECWWKIFYLRDEFRVLIFISDKRRVFEAISDKREIFEAISDNRKIF